jgi:hypothetical protein
MDCQWQLLRTMQANVKNTGGQSYNMMCLHRTVFPTGALAIGQVYYPYGSGTAHQVGDWYEDAHLYTCSFFHR